MIAALALSFNPPSTPPSNSNSRRNLFSRQSAVYPNIDGGVSSSCGESVPYFLLGDGALATSTGTFAAPAGADSAPFKPTANPGPNDIAGVWKQVGGTVEWTSPEFDGGQAVICIVSGAGSSGGITAYFHGTPPSDCTPLTFGAAPGMLKSSSQGRTQLKDTSLQLSRHWNRGSYNPCQIYCRVVRECSVCHVGKLS